MKNHKLTQEEFIERVRNKNPEFFDRIEIIGEYKRQTKPIKCKCKKCGLEFNRNAITIINGICACPECDRGKNQYTSFNTETFMKKFQEIDTHNIKVFGEYKNMHTKMDCECKLGHKFQRKPEKLLLDRECPYCAKFNAKPLKGF